MAHSVAYCSIPCIASEVMNYCFYGDSGLTTRARARCLTIDRLPVLTRPPIKQKS